MRLILICLVLLIGTVEFGAAAPADDNYSDLINMTVSANISDGSSIIARFLGFKCPKGHRCLPVLECLPCDYGTYKANEGSDLCTTCPGGCTTLRKGAESKKECVPKCPPGYEESECGKTCTKCRPGFYKSTWKNKPCSACPVTSSWDPVVVGRTKRIECDDGGDPSDPTETTITPTGFSKVTGDRCRQMYGTCTKDEYENKRLARLEGSGCKKFCHCAHSSTSQNGNVSYYWEEQTCAAGTLFDESLPSPVCNHENLVICPDTTTTRTTTVTPTSSAPIAGQCNPGAPCTNYEETQGLTRPLLGTLCHGYCVCEGLQWTKRWCYDKYVYDPSLYIPTCNFADYVNCNDYNSTITPPPPSPPVPEDLSVPIGGSCTPGDVCTFYELSVGRVTSYYGTNCTQYCVCKETTKSNGDTVLTWQKETCPTQTILDQNLPTPNCNWKSKSVCVECPYAMADIVFVLDSSGSVGSTNFQKMLEFVNQIIQVFTVSSQTTRFALVTYGDSVYQSFYFSTYENKTQLQNAVRGISYPGGYTYTHEALQFVQNRILGSNDNRMNATDIVIVLTDGKSTYPTLTTYYASQLRSVADLVMAVGIGSADKTELEYIATSAQHVYFIDSFDALNVLKKQLRQETCVSSSGMGTTLKPTSPTGTQGTATVQSTAVTSPTTKANTSTPGWITVPVTPDGCPTTNCSGIRFIAMAATNCTKYCQCDTATYQWILNRECPSDLRFNNLHQVCDWKYNVDPTTCWPSLPVIPPATQVPTTLDPADPTSPSKNMTPSTTTPAITTTPDHSLNACTPGASCTPYEESSSRTIPWPGTDCAGYCRCVGGKWVGQWCDPDLAYDQNLYIPACNWEDKVTCNEDPSAPTVTRPPTKAPVTPDLSVPEYGTCSPGGFCTSYEKTTNRVLTYYGTNCTQYCECRETTLSDGSTGLRWLIKHCPAQTLLDQNLPSPNCNWKLTSTCVECPQAIADIVFVLDSSGSVGTTNFAKMQDFVNQIIQVFDVSPSTTQFAALTYGTSVYQNFSLSRYTSKTVLQNAVKNLYYYQGYTYTNLALNFVENTILTEKDNRPSASDIVIVITDGMSTWPSLTKTAADRLHKVADMVFTVGIGNADKTELNYIASSSQNVYFIDNFDALTRLKNELRQGTCGSTSSLTSTAKLTTTTNKPITTTTVTTNSCPTTSCSGISFAASPATGCTQYCQCNTLTGTWVYLGTCSSGMVFNNQIQRCDWAYIVNVTTCRP